MNQQATGAGNALIVTQGDQSIEQHGTAVAAAAEAARVEIESRIAAAERRPRNVDMFRSKILKDCQRPGFAEVALYRKPVGKQQNPITGNWEEATVINFSVRFVEAALAHFRNVHVVARIIHEDARGAQLTVGALDVENNVGYAFDVTVEKTVERRDAKGRNLRGMRTNSAGKQVYIVEATGEEFKLKLAAERSKMLRDNGQRLLPRDILDECREAIDATLKNEHAKDPDSAKKRVLDRFASIGITPEMLREYVGPPLDALTPDLMAELAVIFNSVRDRECTWQDVLDSRTAPAEGEEQKNPRTDSLRESILATRDRTRKPEAAEEAKP